MTTRTARAVLVTIAALLACCGPLSAAAALNPLAIEGPVADAYAVRPIAQVPAVAALPLDVAAARLEDESRDAAGLPSRFAIPEATWLTPETGGTWEQLDERHLLWRTRITAPGAVSLNLGFTGFRLPKGARLGIYPADLKSLDDRRGQFVFTREDNKDHGELWTPVVASNDIVVELVLPVSERDDYRLELTSINRGYRFFGADAADLDLDKQGSCNIDVVCPEGDAWQAEIHSVGAYSTGGSIFCTGSLLNNTAEDGTPYFLTANHCGINAGNAASLVVYWNFESVNCGDLSGGPLTDFQSGATHLASSSASDVTLVVLDDPVDPTHEVSFAGWNNGSGDFNGVVGIHHPSGDEKAISFEDDPTTTTSYLQSAVPGAGTHIRVADWDLGTTEPGSSGSPLFDLDRRVVGQLHGGYAACGNNDSDWYGRLSVSWPSVAAWLDPLGTGQATLETWAPWITGLQVVGGGLVADGPLGGPFAPTSTDLVLTNNGTASLDFTVSASVAWVDVSSSGGTLASGASTTLTVSLNAAAGTLPLGVYSGSVDVTNVTDGDGGATLPLNLTVGVPEPIHVFDLTTDPGWDMQGGWDWGQPQGLGGSAHGNPDPASGYTGSNVLGYNLGGDYPANLPETHLTTTAIDFANLAQTSLRFQRWLNVEQPSYDQASISLSTDGVIFTEIWSNGAEITDSGWTAEQIDISALADGQPTVYLRWTMGSTDGSWEYSGWNLDDIEIWALPPAASSAPDVPAWALGVGSYPNPFNPATRVTFVLPQAGRARVGVYDLRGRLVRTLVAGDLPAGPGHADWDGADETGRRAPSGVYLARVMAGGEVAQHKMMLLK